MTENLEVVINERAETRAASWAQRHQRAREFHHQHTNRRQHGLRARVREKDRRGHPDTITIDPEAWLHQHPDVTASDVPCPRCGTGVPRCGTGVGEECPRRHIGRQRAAEDANRRRDEAYAALCRVRGGK